MHGSVTGEPLDGCHIVDRFLLYGDNDRLELLRHGTDPERLLVCGAPYLDNRPVQSGIVHPQLQSAFGLRERRPYVLVATSGPGHCTSFEHFDRLVEGVMRLTLERPDVDFVAKLHRKDRHEYYRGAAARVPGHRLQVVRHGHRDVPVDIFSWLQGCSAVLTATSTVAVEAMLMGVPVITMDFAGEYRDVDFIDAGATLHVRSESELSTALTAALGRSSVLLAVERRAAAFVNGAFGPLDGRSADRAAALIATSNVEAGAGGSWRV
jgi:UDP-N-acetylglucosamine 2-epimerase